MALHVMAAAMALAMGQPAPAAAQTEPAQAAAATPGETVRALLADEMARRRIPGLQVAVVQGGRIVFQGAWGVADLETRAPVTEQTVFPFNSMTKVFTGVAALQLVEADKLDLEASISTYLDDLPEAWRGITVHQLLTHTSGLPDIIDPDTGALIGDGSEADAWARVRALPMDARPGESSSYNQTNYALLGRIIDRLEGRPFAEVFRARQFDPAGMTGAGFGDSRDWRPGKARSYRYQRPTLSSPGDLVSGDGEFAPFMRTAAGAEGTATDLARWIIALQAGQLIDRASLPTLWTPATLANGERTRRALGWEAGERAANRWAGQSGGNRGAFAIYPDDDVAVVILTNLAGASPEQLLDPVAAAFVPGFKLPGATRLRLALQAADFQDAPAVLEAVRRADPGLTYPEGELSDWGYRLLKNAQPDQAIAVFGLAVGLHPESSGAEENLAYALEITGKAPEAMEHYRRAVALDPANAAAKRRLTALEAG